MCCSLFVALQNDPIEQKELLLVKNYIKGSLLRSFDGVFESMDRYKHLIQLGVDINYYDYFQSRLDKITKERVFEMAQNLVSWDKMLKVIAGSKIEATIEK